MPPREGPVCHSKEDRSDPPAALATEAGDRKQAISAKGRRDAPNLRAIESPELFWEFAPTLLQIPRAGREGTVPGWRLAIAEEYESFDDRFTLVHLPAAKSRLPSSQALPLMVRMAASVQENLWIALGRFDSSPGAQARLLHAVHAGERWQKQVQQPSLLRAAGNERAVVGWEMEMAKACECSRGQEAFELWLKHRRQQLVFALGHVDANFTRFPPALAVTRTATLVNAALARINHALKLTATTPAPGIAAKLAFKEEEEEEAKGEEASATIRQVMEAIPANFAASDLTPVIDLAFDRMLEEYTLSLFGGANGIDVEQDADDSGASEDEDGGDHDSGGGHQRLECVPMRVVLHVLSSDSHVRSLLGCFEATEQLCHIPLLRSWLAGISVADFDDTDGVITSAGGPGTAPREAGLITCRQFERLCCAYLRSYGETSACARMVFTSAAAGDSPSGEDGEPSCSVERLVETLAGGGPAGSHAGAEQEGSSERAFGVGAVRDLLRPQLDHVVSGGSSDDTIAGPARRKMLQRLLQDVDASGGSGLVLFGDVERVLCYQLLRLGSLRACILEVYNTCAAEQPMLSSSDVAGDARDNSKNGGVVVRNAHCWGSVTKSALLAFARHLSPYARRLSTVRIRACCC